MKHLLKKKYFTGGGKSKQKVEEPKPSVLNPPNLGAYTILESHSIGEVIDLISDGPIEGLVNQNGELLKNDNILQGVYLNDTPVEITSTPRNVENFLGSININNTLNLLGDIYYVNKSSTQSGGYISRIYENAFGKKKSIKNLLLLANESNQENELNKIFIMRSAMIQFANWGIRLDGQIVHNNSNIAIIYSNGIERNDIVQQGINFINSRLANNLVDINEKTFLNRNIEKYNSLLNRSFELSPKTKKAFIICRLGAINDPFFTIDSVAGKSIYKTDGLSGLKILDDFYFSLSPFEAVQKDTNFLITPEINPNGTFTGKFYGFIVFEVPVLLNTEVKENVGRIVRSGTSNEILTYYNNGNSSLKGAIFGYFIEVLTAAVKVGSQYSKYRLFSHEFSFTNAIVRFADRNCNLKFVKGIENFTNTFKKYNFTNIAVEFKNGEERQAPLNNFENVCIDHILNANLLGPFNLSGGVERLPPIDRYTPANQYTIGQVDGSDDRRGNRNFSSWNNDNSYNEESVPFTHTIANPNVSHVFFTLSIDGLSDTIDIDEGTQSSSRKIGEQRPAIVKIEVRIGITRGGISEIIDTKQYAISAIVNGTTLIDFGSPSLTKKYSAIRDITNGNQEGDISEPYELPIIQPNEDVSKIKRFIQIVKLSGETNSTLIRKNISLYKVTEIIPNKLSYPFSALVGLKLDSRVFSDIPNRTFDCRLKRILVPSNYNPLNEDENFKDKRYISKKSEYSYDNLIYEGDWDGTFKLSWTDNPAWILYDLLTNQRYGLGRYLDQSQINKWELYKIARFCDAIDEDGFFIGVSDGVGGLEPRYSCNLMIKESTKIYDIIVAMANLFRGFVYYSNSEINFLDDRPRTPIITFSNTNIKDGIFNYSNVRKDQQYNTIEVSYLDRFDNFKNKIEYVEDEQDIRKRGVFKSKIETYGVTSKAMARRIGQHMIYQTIKENQAIEFAAGLEALLCRPGDLIIIEDDLKTRATNFGRILEINNAEKSLFLENEYISGEYNGVITAYNPTGYSTNEDLEKLAIANRSRLDYFDVLSGLIDNSDNILTGRYYFDSYKQITDDLFFPLYTGSGNAGHKTFCYYNTGVTGFVFSTGLPYQDNNIYDKVITNTGVNIISNIIAQTGQSGDGNDYLRELYRYDANLINKRSGSFSYSFEKMFTELNREYIGILESEINTVNYPQITNLYITGFDNLTYGCKVFLDKENANTNLISNIKAGSSYRIGRINAEDQIYKILTIKEQNQNEYIIAASKYNTGKFIEIENFSSEDFLPATYFSGVSNVGNINIEKLNAPIIDEFTTGTADSNGFSLKASWQPVTDAQKYKYKIYNEISTISFEDEISETGVLLNDLTNLGSWKLNLYAISTSVDKINSEVSKTGIFIGYYNSAVTPLTKAAILNFTVK